MDRLPAEAEELCANSPYDFSDLKAVFINCTLKRSPEVSNTEGLADLAMTIMRRTGGGVELIRAVDNDPSRVQVVYGIDGERDLTEREVPWLPGYEGAKPVRIGNGAHAQLQLDALGEVLNALQLARDAGLPEARECWPLGHELARRLETVWALPDHGLWEVRGPPQHFTHSKVMAWVGVDRAIAGAEQLGLDAPLGLTASSDPPKVEVFYNAENPVRRRAVESLRRISRASNT